MDKQSNQTAIRYEMRNEIETIIKKLSINRTNFHEVGKNQYEKVIRTLYYSYCNYQKYPTIQLAYLWTRFRDSLHRTKLIPTDWNNWNNYINQIDTLIPNNNFTGFYYLLVDGGWLYEGKLTELKQVLYEYPIWMDDFYIFPKDYKWMIHHCDDGACLYKIWKD